MSNESKSLDCSGDVQLNLVDDDGVERSLTLNDAYGMSSCPFNLVSLGKLWDMKIGALFDPINNDAHLFLPTSTVKIPIIKKNGLFQIKHNLPKTLSFGAASGVHVASGVPFGLQSDIK